MNMLREKIKHGVPSLAALLVMALAGAAVLHPVGASAARVDDLYTAIVPVSPRAGNSLKGAFDRALGEVLIKVTGVPGIASDISRAGAMPDASSLVQQYSRLPDNQVSVSFDPRAIRDALDVAGLPVWNSDRPLVAVWLAVDDGRGQRIILADGSGEVVDKGDSENDAAAAITALELSGEARGLPLVLPLMDTVDLTAVSFAEVWGNFRDPIMQASQRYGADALLVGRARSFAPESKVRWSLTLGDERTDWDGYVGSGPERAAEYLAQRLATYADSADTVRVRVTNVASLEIYGQLRRYLVSLNLIESATVAKVSNDQLEFDLVIRGDLQRLESALDRSAMLQPATSESDLPDFGRRPDLVYAWTAES
ncbi:MAG: DUF2066 domain-containing protein [Gammaproteobacteria bacterium]